MRDTNNFIRFPLFPMTSQKSTPFNAFLKIFSNIRKSLEFEDFAGVRSLFSPGWVSLFISEKYILENLPLGDGEEMGFIPRVTALNT